MNLSKYGIMKYFLIELWKISMKNAYNCGYVIGYLRGMFLFTPKEETEEEKEAREIYNKQLNRISEILKEKGE